MFPDLTLFYMSIYGGFGYDVAATDYPGLATGIPQAGNPPYSVNDFLEVYPKFAGIPVSFQGALTQDSQTVVVQNPPQNLAVGQLITGSGIPSGTIIQGISGNNITISQAATATGNNQLSVYTAPLVPIVVIQVYLNLAYASLMSSRWRELWSVAMGLYIAHFVTLWLQSEGNPVTTPGQAAAQGMARGITVSKSVGDVGVSYQPLAALEGWAAWNLTVYGQQLATFARVVGAGAVYVR
jgi:hypothetical protein